MRSAATRSATQFAKQAFGSCLEPIGSPLRRLLGAFGRLPETSRRPSVVARVVVPLTGSEQGIQSPGCTGAGTHAKAPLDMLSDRNRDAKLFLEEREDFCIRWRIATYRSVNAGYGSAARFGKVGVYLGRWKGGRDGRELREGKEGLVDPL